MVLRHGGLTSFFPGEPSSDDLRDPDDLSDSNDLIEAAPQSRLPSGDLLPASGYVQGLDFRVEG
jgi:hypothetical protein